MATGEQTDKLRRLERLQAEAAALEAEIEAGQSDHGAWKRTGYYLTYYATAGFFLGMVAALVSLMFNIIGASVAGKDPLQLIKVYLTFGLGGKALDPAFDNGLALAMGCVLYIATGMLLGIVFHVILTRYASRSSLPGRLAWATAIAAVVWLDNKELPWWVALATHLVFGWTMALIYPWGLYHPYRLQTDSP